ncbi:putative transmembrane protein [Toxoplasma gondii RUB]|uniref:Putative transmembrane protein n=1 Tax=Toxoplasma gondii RUB TaxID=935652 RepID=A0A086LZP9_TOXGO|nr:putative transmembrane protein [Toxoplasma gondii RUB]
MHPRGRTRVLCASSVVPAPPLSRRHPWRQFFSSLLSAWFFFVFTFGVSLILIGRGAAASLLSRAPSWGGPLVSIHPRRSVDGSASRSAAAYSDFSSRQPVRDHSSFGDERLGNDFCSSRRGSLRFPVPLRKTFSSPSLTFQSLTVSLPSSPSVPTSPHSSSSAFKSSHIFALPFSSSSASSTPSTASSPLSPTASPPLSSTSFSSFSFVPLSSLYLRSSSRWSRRPRGKEKTSWGSSLRLAPTSGDVEDDSDDLRFPPPPPSSSSSRPVSSQDVAALGISPDLSEADVRASQGRKAFEDARRKSSRPDGRRTAPAKKGLPESATKPPLFAESASHPRRRSSSMRPPPRLSPSSSLPPLSYRAVPSPSPQSAVPSSSPSSLAAASPVEQSAEACSTSGSQRRGDPRRRVLGEKATEAERGGRKRESFRSEKEARDKGGADEKGDKGEESKESKESKDSRPTMEECVELLEWLVAENVEIDASVLTVDSRAASLRLLLPHAASQFLPTQVQLRREDYHPLRSFSASPTDAESALEPKKKSPFAFVRHPLRLTSQASTSVGPSLPFTWMYTSDSEQLSPEHVQAKRWELLRPGDHLRVRVARAEVPDGRSFVAEHPAALRETETEERRGNGEGRNAYAEGEETPGERAKNETRDENTEETEGKKDGDERAGRGEQEEEKREEENLRFGSGGGKKGKKRGISLRIAFGWPPAEAKEELENWRQVKAEAERRLGENGRKNVTGERLKAGLEKLIHQDIAWALPRLSPLEVTSYLPAHLTSPRLHPHPSETLDAKRRRGPSSLLQEKKALLEEIRKTQREERSSETRSRENAPEGGARDADSAGGSADSGVQTPERDRGVSSSGVQTPEQDWIPPLKPPSRQPHRSRIIGILNDFLLVEVDVAKRERAKGETGTDEGEGEETKRNSNGEDGESHTREQEGKGKGTLVALLPIEEFGHILEWVRHREKVYIHRNTFTYGLTMRGNKPWEGFRFAEDEKTGRNDELESKAPPSSIDLYFSCVQKFPLDLDFPATSSLTAFLPPIRGPPRCPAAGALAKVGTQAVLETANYLFNSSSSPSSTLPSASSSSASSSSSSSLSSSSLPFLPLPSTPWRPPWVVVMSAHPPIPAEVAYMLFFHQPPNHLRAEVEKFHRFMEEQEREHLADTLALYKPYGAEGKHALERWHRAHRQSLRQRQTAGFPWWEERGEAAREAELQNILGYYQYKKLLLAREYAKEETALERMHNIVFVDRHGDALEDITHWLLDERKSRLTPKFVKQFVEDIQDRCAVLRRLDLTEPLRTLIREKERLQAADVSALPLLTKRKELLTRKHRPVSRARVEAAVDIHPEARLRLLQLLDLNVPFMDPVAWMLKIHQEKRQRASGDPFSPPLWEMFLLHARVNLQKAAPPDDVPTYEAWQKAEGAGRRRSKRTVDGPAKHVVDPVEAMIDQLPEGAADFLRDSQDAAVGSQTLRNLQRDLASALLPRASRREGMMDDFVSIKDLHPELPELSELAGGKAANQRCEVFLPLTDAVAGAEGAVVGERDGEEEEA